MSEWQEGSNHKIISGPGEAVELGSELIPAVPAAEYSEARSLAVPDPSLKSVPVSASEFAALQNQVAEIEAATKRQPEISRIMGMMQELYGHLGLQFPS